LIDKQITERELKSCHIKLLEGDIIVIEVKPNTEVLLEDVKEMVKTAGELGNNKLLKNLIVAGEYSSMNSQATLYMKSEEAHRFTRTEAIVISSLAQRIVGNFYLGIVTQKRPSKLFNSVEKAMEWLKSQP
jgi:hypothetical protein